MNLDGLPIIGVSLAAGMVVATIAESCANAPPATPLAAAAAAYAANANACAALAADVPHATRCAAAVSALYCAPGGLLEGTAAATFCSSSTTSPALEGGATDAAR